MESEVRNVENIIIKYLRLFMISFLIFNKGENHKSDVFYNNSAIITKYTGEKDKNDLTVAQKIS